MEELATQNRRAIAAILFLTAGMYTMDAYSTLNSSPWTAESFGGDEEKMAHLREYVFHAMMISSFYCLMSAVIGRSWFPILGAIINNAYLYFLYERAANRGLVTESTDWAKNG